MGHILLLAAGLLVLTVISAGSVHLVNKAREDARAVVHTLEVENQISLVQLQLRRAESAQRGYVAVSINYRLLNNGEKCGGEEPVSQNCLTAALADMLLADVASQPSA